MGDEKQGVTALYVASNHGYAGVVKLLLEVEGIKINARDTSGGTPLFWASEEGHKNVVTAANGGIDVNMKCHIIGQRLFLKQQGSVTETWSDCYLQTKGIEINVRDTRSI